jgi:hypothetical protein
MLHTLESQPSVRTSNYDRPSGQVDIRDIRLAERLATKHLGDLAEGCHRQLGK